MNITSSIISLMSDLDTERGIIISTLLRKLELPSSSTEPVNHNHSISPRVEIESTPRVSN